MHAVLDEQDTRLHKHLHIAVIHILCVIAGDSGVCWDHTAYIYGGCQVCCTVCFPNHVLTTLCKV